jgi:hypothetical protein
MERHNYKRTVLLAISALVVAGISCNVLTGNSRVGPLQTESESVELGDAESVRVEIDMGAGELDVSGGASKLLEADFTYNVEELKPEVTFNGSTLGVRTPDVDIGGIDSLFNLDDYRYEWDLRFNDDVEMNMNINLGAGKTDLNLGSLSLMRLDVNSGAGELRLNLSDSSMLTHMDVDLGAGEVRIDLTGDWQDDLDAVVKGGVGAITIMLPNGVGVRVDVSEGIGSVNTSGLTRDGGDYVNDAYGGTSVTMTIEIIAGVGEINLEVGD